MRILGLATTAAIIALLLGCSTTAGPSVPDGTPGCEEACDIAWACGGVLENDREGCKSACVDDIDTEFRTCVFENDVGEECGELASCKVYAPGEPPTGSDDTDAG